jgi:hypothetical protein
VSGPKVVRVITREERIAICQGLLARYAAALEDWERTARRNPAVTDADVQAMRSRYDSMVAALAAEKFGEIDGQVAREIEFVRQQQEVRLNEVIAREKRLRRVKQRSKDTSALPKDAPPAASVTEAQRSLARELKGAEDDSQSFDEWLAENAGVVDPEIAALEDRLAELHVLLGEGQVAKFEARVTQVATEPSESRRALLRDGLTVDLATAVRNARQRLLLQARLRGLIAELRAMRSQSATQFAESIAASLGSSADAGARLEAEAEVDALAKLEADALEAVETEREALAARARREVVLKGLASLGYQVNEGMETAWAQAGSVVMKRPTQPGYGVELTGTGDKGRMQARVVAFRSSTAPADTSRDHDAERMWCSDVSHLKKAIADGGGDFIIERALGVGATPVKAVTDGATEADATALATPASLKERTRS